MPLQEIAFPYVPTRVETKYLKTNQKLLTESEIAAIIDGLKDKADGRYRKEIFNRIQMPTNLYGIIKHKSNYYAIFTQPIYVFKDIKVKIAQDLRTGEWLRLKVYKNKYQAENEFNYLESKDLVIHKFSRRTRKNTIIDKDYILTKITPGVDLMEFIQVDKHIPTVRCLELAIDILKKVNAIHEDGYLLCKLTPEDILCGTSNNTVSICNFDSISKMDSNRQAMFPLNGTDIYIAPELFEEYALIQLLRAMEVAALSDEALTKTKLLSIIDNSPILSKFKHEKKDALIEKAKQLTQNDIKRLLTKIHANTRVNYTYDETTDCYSVGVILKVLFNIPVEEINKPINPTDSKYFKIGRHKSFYDHGPIIKWLDGMTSKNPESRVKIAEALEFFETYYQKLLPLTQIKIGLIDIADFDACRTYFDLCRKEKRIDEGFWTATFKVLIQQMDEIYIVSRRADYTGKIRIQKSLVRLGVLYNKDIIVTPTVDALAEVVTHIKAKHPTSAVCSFTYFDLSLYSKAENSFYTQHEINGVGLSPHGHHMNGYAVDNHDRALPNNALTIIITPEASSPRQLIPAEKVRELLIENGINVITIDVSKTLAIYAPQLARCLTTVTAEQFETMNNLLKAEIKKCEAELKAKASDPVLKDRLSRMKKTLSDLTTLKANKALSYAIAHSTLDNLQQQEKLPASSIGWFFTKPTVFEQLQNNLKIPEQSTLRLHKLGK